MKRVNFTQKFKIELLVPRCRATLGELNGTFDVALTQDRKGFYKTKV